MKNNLNIERIIKKDNEICVRFSASGEWKKYILCNEITNRYDHNIEDVPDSVAVIPTISNLLPVAFVYHLSISVKELDDEFKKSINKILDGYKGMYPDMDLEAIVNIDKVVKNAPAKNKCASLFSGGVDATATVYRHLDENPDIVTIFGSDVKLSDEKGIENVDRRNREFCEKHSLKYERIYSSFTTFLNYKELNESPELKTRGHGWWHEFQHGIGIIGLVAPLSYIKGYKTVYIASSYHISQKGQYTCASDPTIDNMVKYALTDTCHDGYELTRQDKIKFICKYADEHKLEPYLRVCWESTGGANCCHCEKCRRTYLGILAEGYNPKKFGLNMNKKQYRRTVAWFKRHLVYKYDKFGKLRYDPIQSAFKNTYKKENSPKGLEWFYDVDICSKKLPAYTKYIDKIRRKIGIE